MLDVDVIRMLMYGVSDGDGSSSSKLMRTMRSRDVVMLR